MPIYANKNLILASNQKSDIEFAKAYDIKEVKGYSTIEGCVRQSTDNPIKKTEVKEKPWHIEKISV